MVEGSSVHTLSLAERVAAIEAKQDGLHEDIAEIKRDLKALLAFVNADKGARRAFHVGAIIVGIAGTLLTIWHFFAGKQ